MIPIRHPRHPPHGRMTGSCVETADIPPRTQSVDDSLRNLVFHPDQPLMHFQHLLDLFRRRIPPRVDFLVEPLVDDIIHFEILRQPDSVVVRVRAIAIADARCRRRGQGGGRRGHFLTFGRTLRAVRVGHGVIVDVGIQIVRLPFQAAGRAVRRRRRNGRHAPRRRNRRRTLGLPRLRNERSGGIGGHVDGEATVLQVGSVRRWRGAEGGGLERRRRGSLTRQGLGHRVPTGLRDPLPRSRARRRAGHRSFLRRRFLRRGSRRGSARRLLDFGILHRRRFGLDRSARHPVGCWLRWFGAMRVRGRSPVPLGRWRSYVIHALLVVGVVNELGGFGGMVRIGRRFLGPLLRTRLGVFGLDGLRGLLGVLG